MKKSKFLKKSLAMLLALMLVVAMIPLSAAAQTVTHLVIGGNSVVAEGTVFKAEVARYNDKLTLAVAGGSLGGATLEVAKEGVSVGNSANKMTDADVDTTVTLSDYGVDVMEADSTGGTLTLNLVKNNKVAETYTVELSVYDPSPSASLNVTAQDGTGTYVVDVNNGSHDIDLIVPKGALNATATVDGKNVAKGAHIRVQTQDNATIALNDDVDTNRRPVNATVTDMKGGHYEVAVTGTTASICVVSEDRKNVQKWTINVEEVWSLRSFSYGEYEGKIDYTTKENGRVVPTVTVTIPKADGRDSMGYAVDFNERIDFATYGDTDKLYIDIKNVNMYNGTADKDDAAEFRVNQRLNVGKLVEDGTTYDWNSKIWLDCKGYSKLQEYNLVIKLGQDDSIAIKRAFFNDVEADIDGSEITANLPMQDVDDQPTNLGEVEVVLYTDTADKIDSITGFTKTNSDIDGMDKWIVNANPAVINIRNGKLIVVTAEDKDVVQTYNLTATIEQNTTTANLTGIYIAGDGYKAEGNIVGNTIYFDVPYMTLKVDDWKIYATANSSANVIYKRTATSGTVVRNGVTDMGDLGFDDVLDTKRIESTDNLPDADSANLIHKVISAVNMNDNGYYNDYNIVVNLIKPVENGRTLSNFEISIQNDDPTKDGIAANGYDTNEKVTSRVNAANSVLASASKGTITDKGLDKNNEGEIILSTPYSLRSKEDNGTYRDDLWRILTNIDTVNNGVAFYVKKGATNGSEWWGGCVLSDLLNDSSAFSGNVITQYTDKGNVGNWYVVVLPEDTARTVLEANINRLKDISFDSDLDETGTVYTLTEKEQDPHDYKILYNISVKDAELTVNKTNNVDTSKTEVGEVTGALPWSYTVDAADVRDGKLGKDAGQFLTFGIDAYATLRFSSTLSEVFYSAGDVDGDGEADEGNVLDVNTGKYKNPKLLFVRNDDGSVALYQWVNDRGGRWSPVSDNSLTTVAEDGKSTMKYTFRLKWEDPNTEAVLKSFSIGNATGSINGDKVSVILPYGTDLKGLIPTFTTSEYAKVTLDSKTGDPVVSGKTSVNFSQTVRLEVTSEDGNRTTPYYVTVTLSDTFDDVQPGAWYYENVMQAAAAGIVSGRGDGTFDPNASVTRRDFAIMLTQMLGESNDGSAVSPFVDVDNDDYGVVAIAYCKAHNIISGYEDSTFRPDATITRQEAASMIANAMGVSEISKDTYPDDAEIASWAKNAVYRALAAGLMKGDGATGEFRPTDSITRAEAASIMVNALIQ